MNKNLFEILENTARTSRFEVESILAHSRKGNKYKPFTRTWKTTEVIKTLGVTQGELTAAASTLGIVPEKIDNYYEYTLEQIQQLRLEIHGYQPPRTLPIVSVLSGKGGCSKTTLSVYLAQRLVLDGKRVLFIDTDPQASATSIILGVNPDIEFVADDTIAPFMMSREISLTDKVQTTGMAGLDIIPCCQGASIMDLEGVGKDQENADILDRFWSLKETLTLFKGQYDAIILDTPPTVTFSNMRCAIASNFIITPISPSLTDLCSSTGYENTLKDYLGSLKGIATPAHTLEIFDRRFVITQYNHQLQSHRKYAELIRNIYTSTYDTPFSNMAEVSNTNLNGKTVFEESSAISSYETRKRALTVLNSLLDEIVHDISTLSALEPNEPLMLAEDRLYAVQ